MDMHNHDKRIVITGATGGIGRAVALKLASRGIHLGLAARQDDSLRTLGSECDKAATCELFAGDLTVPHQPEKMMAHFLEKMGDIDVVVHCAGVGLIKSFLDTTDAEFSRVNNLNSRATYLTAQAAVRHFKENKNGLFITLPGILGKAPMRNASAYIASKYAVTGMIKAMAMELQRDNIRFCLLHFGGVDTPFYDHIGMKVARDKMIPPDLAADYVIGAIDTPPHVVLNELVMQPAVHQL